MNTSGQVNSNANAKALASTLFGTSQNGSTNPLYSAFDKNNFDNLQELNNRYNEEMINTLDILEQLVKQSIYTENEYIAYANSFMERKRDYDILCNNPENVKGIPLCECCIPKNIL